MPLKRRELWWLHARKSEMHVLCPQNREVAQTGSMHVSCPQNRVDSGDKQHEHDTHHHGVRPNAHAFALRGKETFGHVLLFRFLRRCILPRRRGLRAEGESPAGSRLGDGRPQGARAPRRPSARASVAQRPSRPRSSGATRLEHPGQDYHGQEDQRQQCNGHFGGPRQRRDRQSDGQPNQRG